MAEESNISKVDTSHASTSSTKTPDQEPDDVFENIAEDAEHTGKITYSYKPPPAGNTKNLAKIFEPEGKPLKLQIRSASTPNFNQVKEGNTQPTDGAHETCKVLQRPHVPPNKPIGPRSVSLTEYPSQQKNEPQQTVHEVNDEIAPLFETPQCLLCTDSQGTFEVNADVLDQVAALEKMLVVVAVTGLYRTGKSYLLNRLAGYNSGFSVGSSIQSHTKGIWIWVRDHPLQTDQYLVLLDTEGLGDVKKGDEEHDRWLFCLATLLSSVLVYNAMGQINEDALAKLSFITNMSKSIRTSSDTTDNQADANFDFFFPAFIFVLRDFGLRLVIDGREVTEDEYLDDSLALKSEDDERSVKYNMSRKCIRRYFRNRKCFAFDRPAAERGHLQNLDQIKESDLLPGFVKETQAFCDHVFKHGDVKKLGTERPLTGRMWATLVRNYVEALKTGALPCVEKALCAIGHIENQLAKEEALKFYVNCMETTYLPTPDDKSLSEIHSQAMFAAIRRYLDKTVDDKENESFKQLNELINCEYKRIITKNKEASRAKCRQMLGVLETEMLEKIERDEYFKPGGLNEYTEDRQKIKSTYEATEGLGTQAEAVLLEYFLEKTEQEKRIIEEDKAITEKQRKEETERQSRLNSQMLTNNAEESENEKNLIEYEKEKALKMCNEEMENNNALKKKQQEAYIEEVTRAREDEFERLLQEGFAVEAEKIAKAIENTKEAKKSNKNCTIL